MNFALFLLLVLSPFNSKEVVIKHPSLQLSMDHVVIEAQAKEKENLKTRRSHNK